MKIHYVPDNERRNEPLSEILMAVSKIEGFDIELALSRIGGKQKVLEEAIEQTVNSVDEKLGKMDKFLLEEDLYNFSIEAHGLKNALVGIGIGKISSFASQLEEYSKNGNLLMCKEKFIEFFDLMMDYSTQLKDCFPQENIIKKSKGSRELLFQIIKETTDLLSAFEQDDALDCIDRLKEITFGDEIDDMIKYVIKRIKAYKYDEAAFVLKSILTKY